MRLQPARQAFCKIILSCENMKNIISLMYLVEQRVLRSSSLARSFPVIPLFLEAYKSNLKLHIIPTQCGVGRF